jgi:hypothetical protein
MRRIEKSDYHKLANKKKVLWIGSRLPSSTIESTQWKCDLCGRELQKSYQAMRSYPNPCRCRSGTIKTPDDYRALAKSLSRQLSCDVEFPNQDYPKNTYDKVLWLFNDVEISESYHNLAYYDKIPEYIKSAINGKK